MSGDKKAADANKRASCKGNAVHARKAGQQHQHGRHAQERAYPGAGTHSKPPRLCGEQNISTAAHHRSTTEAGGKNKQHQRSTARALPNAHSRSGLCDKQNEQR